MNIRIARGLLIVISLVATSLAGAAAEDYDYPLKDRFVATVVGTPEAFRAKVPKENPLKSRSIAIFPDREVPDAFFFENEMRYSTAFQDEAAPLVFLIAGTGASHSGGKNTDMAKAFYQAGFHVISLSSPTYVNFLVAASHNGVPGHAYHDAEDLYRVMETVWNEHKPDVTATEFYITGYSLGGFNTAFVTMLDEDRQVFNFTKALLINPPVSLYNSISILDRMVENIPGGEDNFGRFFDKLVAGISQIYSKQADTLDFGDDLLYKAYEALDLQNEELAALIGVSFRLSSGSLVFASDVYTNYGFVKPSDLTLTRYDNTTQYRRVVNRLGFTDFYHEYFFPYYRDENPDLSRDDFIERMSLTNIQEYLRTSEKIEVMHNEDDVILEPGEINFFREVFGDRAKIYPAGGHCGNMAYRDNVAHMVGVFR